MHRQLRDHARECVVLRPTWLMQNLAGQHGPAIRDEGAIYSGTGEGRVAFIDAGDIAAVAAVALMDASLPDVDMVLTGPEALSYDDVARVLSHELGRPVAHRRLHEAAMARRFASAGLPSDYAALLAGMDAAIAQGSEDRVTDAVERITGRRRPPSRGSSPTCARLGSRPERGSAGSVQRGAAVQRSERYGEPGPGA